MSGEKIHFGIIGCGDIVRQMHLPALQQVKSAEVVALCDTNPETLHKTAADFEINSTYPDFHKLIENPKVEVVLVAVPPVYNKDIVLYAAGNRKHILLEKPIATSLQDAQEILDECGRSEVRLCVNHQRRFSACEQKARQMIQGHDIGEILHVRMCHFSDGLDWYRQDNSWVTNPKFSGGGGWLLWGIHYVDLFRFLTGDEVARIYTEMGSKMQESGKGEESAFALMRSKGKTTGELQLSCVHRPVEMEADNMREKVEIYGSLGTITYYRQMGEMKIYSVRHEDPEEIILHFESNRHGYSGNMINMSKILLEKFIAAILTGGEVPVSGEEAYKALQIIIAGYESAKTKKAISI